MGGGADISSFSGKKLGVRRERATDPSRISIMITPKID